MKLLADQDVYAATIRFLAERGHDVVTAAQLGLSRVSDTELLQTAKVQGRVLVTRDRDFGNLIFVHGEPSGVVYLRMLPTTQALVHAELDRVFSAYTADELSCAFVVVEPGRYRFRRSDASGNPGTGPTAT